MISTLLKTKFDEYFQIVCQQQNGFQNEASDLVSIDWGETEDHPPISGVNYERGHLWSLPASIIT